MSKILAELKADKSFVETYASGLSGFLRSGALNFLRERSAVRIPQVFIGDAQASAAEAHRSRGYTEALDDIFNFIEKFINPSETKLTGKAPIDFGAISKSLASGDISEEEANALRLGQTPDYRKYYIKPNKGNSSIDNAGKNPS